MTLTIGSLCSGYGGLDLGVQLVADARVSWHVEYAAGPRAILRHHWPDVPLFEDLTALDPADLPPVDVLTAGYPCQPFSLAGKRKGSTDERHLWPYIARAVGELRPRWCVFENVAGHVSLGLGAVLGDLSALGYDARWGVVRASDAGAPHRRERLFIVATDTDRDPVRLEPVSVGGCGGATLAGSHVRDAAGERHERRGAARGRGTRPTDSGARAVPDPDRAGLERRGGVRAAPGEDQAPAHDPRAWGPYAAGVERWAVVTGRPAPSPTELGTRGQQRLSARFVEWLMGVPEGHVTDVPGLTRTEQIRALGNGVVPQQAALALGYLWA